VSVAAIARSPEPLVIHVPGRPVSWERDNVIGGKFIRPKSQRAAKAVIATAALIALTRRLGGRKAWSLEGEFELELWAWYPSRVFGDVDRLSGLYQDALEGLAYKTDRQISDLIVRRRVDAERARVELTVRRVR
jgi:Holliday junction resolvase RusA-like endonuclease